MYNNVTITDCLTTGQIEYIRELLDISEEAYNNYYKPYSTHMDKSNSVKEIEWSRAMIYGFIDGLYHSESITSIERNRLLGKYVLNNRVYNDDDIKNFKFLRFLT